jgi:predicted secreted Zn-dependent protease
MIRKILKAAAIACVVMMPGPALAQDESRVTLYPVLGSSASEVYIFIQKRAPKIKPNATFAFTAIATKTEKREAKSAAACRYKSFRTAAIYEFFIPRHAEPAALPPATRAKWMGFMRYLLSHEQGHRAIWRACFADYDAQALTLEAADCSALDQAREALFATIKRACLRRDAAYDVIFRKEVLQHPFVREALRK